MAAEAAARVSGKYHLGEGLRNFLIDDKGVIIATNVSADQLERSFME